MPPGPDGQLNGAALAMLRLAQYEKNDQQDFHWVPLHSGKGPGPLRDGRK